MTYTNACAVVLCATNGLIDKMELETIIPATHRAFLAAYQAKLAAKSTTKSEDRRFLNVLQVWMIQRHKITA